MLQMLNSNHCLRQIYGSGAYIANLLSLTPHQFLLAHTDELSAFLKAREIEDDEVGAGGAGGSPRFQTLWAAITPLTEINAELKNVHVLHAMAAEFVPALSPVVAAATSSSTFYVRPKRDADGEGLYLRLSSSNPLFNHTHTHARAHIRIDEPPIPPEIVCEVMAVIHEVSCVWKRTIVKRSMNAALLSLCALGMDRETVRLLELGADPNYMTPCKDTPLTVAAWRGSSSCVQALLDHHVDVDQYNGHGFTPLIYACDFGMTAVALQLLKHGADPRRPDVETRGYPICVAAFSGRKSIVDVLLLHGLLVPVHSSP